MTVALILAAGSGERLGADRPKALVELAGRRCVQWSIDALLRDVVGIERIDCSHRAVASARRARNASSQRRRGRSAVT
jgi:choline kinase